MMETVSEEQVLFNKLRYDDQRLIIGIMKTLQPCEIEKEKEIPEKLGTYTITDETISGIRKSLNTMINIDIIGTINEIIDYLKSEGE